MSTWLRPALFGAIDGLVTNMALVAAVGAAKASPHYIILTGVAGLAAGAFSMALGEYVSVGAQRDTLRGRSDLAQQDMGTPLGAAGASFLCFAVGALVPLVPYLAGFTSLAASLAAGLIGLFTAGVLSARYTSMPWFVSGVRQTLFGASAVTVTYLVGAFIGT